MNFYRIFDKIFILLLVIFSISCSTTSIDAEKHVLTPFPGVKYSPESRRSRTSGNYTAGC